MNEALADVELDSHKVLGRFYYELSVSDNMIEFPATASPTSIQRAAVFWAEWSALGRQALMMAPLSKTECVVL